MHMVLFQGMAPFECEVCLKTFSVRPYLNSHKRSAHGMRTGRKREYQCGHCGISLSGKGGWVSLSNVSCTVIVYKIV